MKIKWHLGFLVAVLFCIFSCSAAPITSGRQYFLKLAGRQRHAGCAAEGAFMGYFNKTCSASGPVLRAASDGKTWTKFTITKTGKNSQGQDLVELKTYYPKSTRKPRCSGYVVPEKKDSCTIRTDPMAAKVHIQAKKGDVWALSSVKGKKDTYTIRAYSRKPGCLKYLAASGTCGENSLQLDAKDDGSGLQHWIITPVKPSTSHPPPSKSPPSLPELVDLPAVNYSIALTGYNIESFGDFEKAAFCDSILMSRAYPQEWIRCVVSFVTDASFRSALLGRKLKQVSPIYVRGYTAFDFVYGNATSWQQAEDAAGDLYNDMNSTALHSIFQDFFNSSTITHDAVDRGEVSVPEISLPDYPLPLPEPLSPLSPPALSPPPPRPSSPPPSLSIPSPPRPRPIPPPNLSPQLNTDPPPPPPSPPPPPPSPPAPVSIPSPVPNPAPVPIPVPYPAPINYALVINSGKASDGISSCLLTSGGKLLTSCTGTGGQQVVQPHSLSIDVLNDMAYMFSSVTSNVTVCEITDDGFFTACNTGLSLSPASCVGNSHSVIDSAGKFIYFMCGGSTNVVACRYNSKAFAGNCQSNTLSGTPKAAYLDNTSNTMYVALENTNKIQACTVNDLTVTCSDMTPTLLYAPNALGGYTVGNATYIFIGTTGGVYGCTVSGTGVNCSPTGSGIIWTGQLPSGGITMNVDNGLAYIPNSATNSIIVCNVAGSSLTNCAVGATGFVATLGASMFTV